MRLVEPVLALCTLLAPGLPLTQDRPDLPTTGPVTVLNMTFNPRTWMLTWKCPENATDTKCFMIDEEMGPTEMTPSEKQCWCKFSEEPLHRGVTLEVKTTVNRTAIQEKLLYANKGREGTAAQNFSCFIYNVDFMNCSWAKGPAAPSDVQYFLYIRDLKKKTDRECPYYLQTSGIHTGCHLQDVSTLRSRNYFLVNGTSQKMGIQFFDSILWSKAIERLNPPDNVTVHCNASQCCVWWTQPRSRYLPSYLDFQYQLDIQRQKIEPGSRNPLIDIFGLVENKYCFPSPEPRAKHAVKIRAADSRGPKWSAWSPPLEFGSEEQTASVTYVYLLVVLGTLACAVVLGFIFKRFLGTRRLWPPIPHIKDKVNDQGGQQTVWEGFPPGPEKAAHEDIVTVQEVMKPSPDSA